MFWVSLAIVSRIWFSLFPIPATISSRLDTHSLSISTERKELTDDEEGVWDSDCLESVEPGIGGVN
jgi:hypothetical protein